MTASVMIPGATERVLSTGGLSFTAYEMGQGPLALCLHGFPDTPATWAHLLPDLAAAGYRAVAVTSRGYEPSSQPADRDYSLAALSGDVVGWIEALGETRAHLIGHDWGSSICHMAAARAPDRVASLTALAVPHPAGFAALVATDFEQLARSWYVFFFQQVALADHVVEQGDWAFLEHLWRLWSPGWTPARAPLERMREAFNRPGVKTAALDYYRDAFRPGHPRAAESQALLASTIIAPVLGLTGAEDSCVSADVFARAMTASALARPPDIQRVPASGHFLHLERPNDVGRRIVSFLGGSGVP